MKTKTHIFSALLCAVELVLYVLILTGSRGTNYFQALSVFICFAAVLVCYILKKADIFMLFGMFFALCGDICLEIATPMLQSEGVTAFFLCQCAYFVFLLKHTEKKKTNIAVRAALIAAGAATTAAVLFRDLAYLPVITVCYILSFAHNIVLALFTKKYVFAAGLLLFFICDIVLGMHYIGDYIPAGENVLAFFELIDCWIFYLPGQVVIALCSVYGINTGKSID